MPPPPEHPGERAFGPAAADLDAAWLAEAGRSARDRLPRTALLLVGILGAAWMAERLTHPSRDRAYAIALAIDAGVGALLVWASRRYAARPRLLLNVTLAGVVVIALVMTAYHVAVRGELEVLTLSLVCLLFGTTTVMPWGTERQLIAGVAIVALATAATTTVPALISMPLAVLAAVAAAGITTFGSALSERQLRALLARDLALGRANVALSDANRLKSEFVSAVSHELRTPLNVIIGYVDMLLDGAFGPPGRLHHDPLLRIRQSAEELHALVSATLDLGRLEQGVVDVVRAPVCVPDLLERIRCDTLGLQQRTRLAFEWRCDDALPPLHTDAAKLAVVLRNLVTNAIKFTDRGSIAVHARARDGGVEISVRDTGIGIPPDVQRIVFEAFRQGDAAAQRSAGGVGLGLHIVRRLLDLLDGRIGLDSEPGVGTTFRIWLPSEVAAPAHVDAAEADAALPPGDPERAAPSAAGTTRAW